MDHLPLFSQYIVYRKDSERRLVKDPVEHLSSLIVILAFLAVVDIHATRLHSTDAARLTSEIIDWAPGYLSISPKLFVWLHLMTVYSIRVVAPPS